MITAPLFVILLVITIVMLKWKKATPGSVLLGLLLGLTMASTVLGGPIVSGITTGMTMLVDAIAKVVR